MFVITLSGVMQIAGAQGFGPTPVRTELVRTETVQEMRVVVGEIMASRRADVATQESGIVIELPVNEGQFVEKGAALAKLDSRRLSLLLAQADADLLAAAAQVTERAVEMENEKSNLELMRQSFDRGAANPKELRDAEAAYDVAEARLSASSRQLDAVKARIDLLMERLNDMIVAAPFDGAVVACHVERGEWLSEGDAVVQLLDLETVEVWLNVPQRFLAAVRRSDEAVTIRAEATGTLYESKATRIIPNVDPKARTFTLIVMLENAEHELIPGISVTAWVPTGDRGEHLTIPKNAVLRNEAGFYVYIARMVNPDEPSKAMPVPVDLLFPIRDRFVVSATGLHEGDRTVVEGNERLFPMAPVQPVDSQTMQASSADEES